MPDATPGLCQCGCGQPAPIAPRNYHGRGIVKGQPFRYIHGHSAGWKGDDVGYYARHAYLRRHYPKTGICEECRNEARTDYALIHDHPPSRSREDYRELCRACHKQYDGGGERNYRAKLTDDAVRDIRRRAATETVSALAREYDVARSAIQRVIDGRGWRHLLYPEELG